jgi:hypothetical protein
MTVAAVSVLVIDESGKIESSCSGGASGSGAETAEGLVQCDHTVPSDEHAEGRMDALVDPLATPVLNQLDPLG